MKQYKYSFKYMTKKNGYVGSEHLYFGEETFIMSGLKKDISIMQLFEELTFIDAYRVKLVRRDKATDKLETIVDSKDDKILVSL